MSLRWPASCSSRHSSDSRCVAPVRIAAGTAWEGKIESIHATGTPGMLVAKGWNLHPHAGTVRRTIVATGADGNVLLSAVGGIPASRRRATRAHQRAIAGRHVLLAVRSGHDPARNLRNAAQIA
ncbi:hypothetical protein P9281_08720 [Caballeronia sp. LP003]|uniref:hypothetical protein n=1 Tax=Caballeronia sp. LP003 TaxID=3038551 RepID=UPI002859B9C0|nr:hypothetical protein [Caballeronia sp. LP003]MDR5786625.1 hypothetical protein [Caballeronia sp. LP003]